MNREERRRFKKKNKIDPKSIGIKDGGVPYINQENRDRKELRRMGIKPKDI